MRIAIIGSLITSIPPDGQASVEKLAYHQALRLANRNHEILLFAPTGSHIPQDRVRMVDIGLSQKAPQDTSGKKPEEVYGAAYGVRQRLVNLSHLLHALQAEKDNYDVILNNCFDEAPVLATDVRLDKPMYHIMHVPILPQAAEIFQTMNTHLIPISDAQRPAMPGLAYTQTVYNGVDIDEFPYSDTSGDYVLYLGSIGPNKNPKDAILAAKEAGVPIKIGGKLKNKAYYDSEIAPLVGGKGVQWIGELHPKDIVALYQGAKAFLFPTLWNEPFGLVAIESLSCGTPVIAYPNGGLVEIVEDGENGYLVHDFHEMAQKIRDIDHIDRKVCRKSAEDRFSMERMVEGYEKVLAQSIYAKT